jgi:hypothetical protein
MINGLKKIILIGGLTLAGGVYTGGNFNNYGEGLKKANEIYENYNISKLEEYLKEEKEQSSDEIKAPYYKLTPSSCSKYARLSANKLFHKKYKPGHAWDLKYDNKIVYEFNDYEDLNDSTINESIRKLIMYNILKPGMMITAKRDMKKGEYKKYKSYSIPGKDKKGNKIEDTHVILYLGINDKEQPEFLHHWYNQREKININDFKDRKNLKLSLILDSPDIKKQ